MILGVIALVATVALPAAGVMAATPGQGSLSTVPSSVSWQGGPLSGVSPVQRQLCPTTTCDDFAIDLNPPPGDTVLTIDIKASTGNTMAIVVFPPGCSTSATPNCYTGYGPDNGLAEVRASIFRPAKGHYVVRTACGACVGATYTGAADLTAPPAAPTSAAGVAALGATAVGPLFTFATTTLANPTGSAALISVGSNTMAEPGISINPTGRAVINSFGPTVWLSDNAGRTWSAPNAAIDATGCTSNDADSVVAADGTLYAVSLCQTGLTNLFFRSTDGGKTWTSSLLNVPLPAGADADRPWIAVDPANPSTVYLNYHSAGAVLASDYTIYVLKSIDGGQTFLPASAPTAQNPAGQVDNTLGGNIPDRLLVDPTDGNRVYIVWGATSAAGGLGSAVPTGDPGFTRIELGASGDGGQTWSVSNVLDAGAGTIAHVRPVSALDSAGNLYIAYSDRAAGTAETHVKLMGSRDHGGTWSAPARVDSGGLNSNVFPALAAGRPGQVDLVWQGSQAHDFNDTGATWAVMFAQSRNALDHPAFDMAPIAALNHAGGICMAGLVGCEALNLNPVLRDFLSVAIDGQGNAHAAWTDSVRGPLSSGGALAPAEIHDPLIVTARQLTGPVLRFAAPQVNTALPNTTASATAPLIGLLTAMALFAGGASRAHRRRRMDAAPVRKSTYYQ